MNPFYVRLRVFRTALQREKYILKWLEENPEWQLDRSIWEAQHSKFGIILLFVITTKNIKTIVLPPYDEVEYFYPAVEEVRWALRKIRRRDITPRWGVNHY